MPLKAYQIRWKSGAIETMYGTDWIDIVDTYHINTEHVDCNFCVDEHNEKNLKWMQANQPDIIKQHKMQHIIDYRAKEAAGKQIEAEQSKLSVVTPHGIGGG